MGCISKINGLWNIYIMAVWVGFFWVSSYWVMGVQVLKTATLLKLFNLNLLPSFSFWNSHIAPVVLAIHQKLNHPIKTNQRKQLCNSEKRVFVGKFRLETRFWPLSILTAFSTRTARKSLERESHNFNIVFNLHKQCVAPNTHTQHTSRTVTWLDNLGMSNDKGCHPRYASWTCCSGFYPERY